MDQTQQQVSGPPSDGTSRAVNDGVSGGVRVELDDTGRVRDIQLDPDVRNLTLPMLSRALVEAFGQAQDAFRAAMLAGDQPYSATASRERLEAASAETVALAEYRFSEISGALYELNRRAGSTW